MSQQVKFKLRRSQELAIGAVYARIDPIQRELRVAYADRDAILSELVDAESVRRVVGVEVKDGTLTLTIADPPAAKTDPDGADPDGTPDPDGPAPDASSGTSPDLSGEVADEAPDDRG